MSFFSINQMVHQSGHSLQRWEFLPLRVFVSLCLSKKIPLYSHMWAKDVKAALQISAFIRFSALTRKKSLRPISFVKGLLQDETCPRPGLFFFFFFRPKDTWAHAAWLPAWTRRRRSCRHSSGALHHHEPISCWNVDLENVEMMKHLFLHVSPLAACVLTS